MPKPRVLAAIVLLAAASSPALAEFRLSLRLSGGPSLLALKDANSVLTDWRTWRIKEVEYNKKLTLNEDRVGTIHLGYDFDIEMLLRFGRFLGLGISAGVINAGLSEKDAYLTIARPTGINNYAHTMTANAFPVIVSGYFLLPLGQKFTVYAKAGGGTLWGKFVEREANKLSASEKYLYPVSQTATSRGTILTAGAGLRFEADEKLAFFVEVSGRKAVLTDFEGEAKDGTKGALYSFEQYDSKFKYWQRRFEIMEHSPGGPLFRNQGKAQIDFSGGSVKLGVVLEF